jgi:RNA-binding protein YlmH
MQVTTLNSNPVQILQYHLYKNTFDDTYVIVANHLQDVFERTLTNMGSAPLLLKTDHNLSDLQINAMQYGINADVIASLN